MLKYIHLLVILSLVAIALLMIPNAIDKQYENREQLKNEYKYQ